jgi:hypothetical protein
MQKPLFARFGVDEATFWKETQGLTNYYKKLGHPLVSSETIYLSHILSYVRAGKFAGLNNEMLHQFGADLEFYPGIPDIFDRLAQMVSTSDRFQRHDIRIEHYVVSTGLRQIILGSIVADRLTDVWACEFLESTAPPGYLDLPDPSAEQDPEIEEVGYVIDNTTKTRAIFEINKGVNMHSEITVNQNMAEENRRIPFANMIYVADGPSDVPVFSIVNRFGGQTLGVYNPESEEEFRQMAGLLDERRVQSMGEANYEPRTQTTRWLERAVEKVAAKISERREQALNESVGAEPGHIVETQEAPTTDGATGGK